MHFPQSAKDRSVLYGTKLVAVGQERQPIREHFHRFRAARRSKTERLQTVATPGAVTIPR